MPCGQWDCFKAPDFLGMSTPGWICHSQPRSCCCHSCQRLSSLSLWNQSAVAADELSELVKTQLAVVHFSTQALDKDMTWEADNVTLLAQPLMFTPTDPQLRVPPFIVVGDSQAHSLMNANTSSATAALGTAKASKMCTGRRLTNCRHAHEGIVNL